jgi:hypothetical protein
MAPAPAVGARRARFNRRGHPAPDNSARAARSAAPASACLHLLVGDLPHDAARHAEHHRTRRDDGVLLDQRPGADQRVLADAGAAEHDRPHADQRVVADLDAVQDDPVADGDAPADAQRRVDVDVHARVVLHVACRRRSRSSCRRRGSSRRTRCRRRGRAARRRRRWRCRRPSPRRGGAGGRPCRGGRGTGVVRDSSRIHVSRRPAGSARRPSGHCAAHGRAPTGTGAVQRSRSQPKKRRARRSAARRAATCTLPKIAADHGDRGHGRGSPAAPRAGSRGTRSPRQRRAERRCRRTARTQAATVRRSQVLECGWAVRSAAELPAPARGW